MGLTSCSCFLLCALLLSSVYTDPGPGGPDGHGPGSDSRDPVDRTCKLIEHYHCDFFADDPQCGTDGRLYNNMCEFSQAHCSVRNLHIASDGPCPTVAGNSTATSGSDAVYQFFCQNLSHQTCGTDQEILCGSDGVTYTNLCLFEKARCQDRSLSVANYLACPHSD